MEDITTLDLHLDYPSNKAIEVNSIKDVGCGMYPCYYVKYKNKIKISTSVTSLIFSMKNFKLNHNFKPPKYLQKDFSFYLKILFKKFRNNIPFNEPKSFLSKFPRDLRYYPTWETIDKRVKKLKPFEIISSKNSENYFNVNYEINKKEKIISETCLFLKNFINKIEKRFPELYHIILIGGKDSQLIHLVPKVNTKKWVLFSAKPNYNLIRKWCQKNHIECRIFFHDNINEEKNQEFVKKVICGDLYSNPTNVRWIPSLERIAQHFNFNCIFWSGTEGDTFYTNHPIYHSKGRNEFFKLHLTRASTWQGNYHQVLKNYTNIPLLSPFHSEEIWKHLYFRFDPKIISKNTDLRSEIGDELFGKKVWWLDCNPGPKPYKYNFNINLYDLYINYIEKSLTLKSV
jgi:hypothetical protein